MHNSSRIYFKNTIWFILTIFVIISDRMSKLWAVNNLEWGIAKPILPILNFHLAFNTGAAYSFLHQASGWQNTFFITLAALVSIWIIYTILTEQNKHACWLLAGLAFILGGALSNAWDRIQYEAVIDFINPHWGDWYFAIFNIADSAITAGAMCLIGYWCFAKK